MLTQGMVGVTEWSVVFETAYPDVLVTRVSFAYSANLNELITSLGFIICLSGLAKTLFNITKGKV